MDMKLILEITNNVVTGAAKMDWDKWKDNMLPHYPYRKNENYFGNPYAASLRARDKRRQRGQKAEVLLINDGEPRDYLFKLYHEDSDSFINDDETEEERLHRVGIALSIERVYPQNNIATVDNCFAIRKDVDSYMNPEFLDELQRKIMNRESLESNELITINNTLDKLDEKTRYRMIYVIAKLYTILSFAPLKDSNVLPNYEHINKYKITAIEWWEKLLGTNEEDLALCQIANIYIRSEEEERGIGYYRKVLQRNKINARDKAIIQEKIKYIGTGRNLIEEAEEKFKDKDYDKACKLLEKFDKEATGFVREKCMGKYKLLFGVSMYRIGERDDDEAKREKYKDMVYDEKDHISRVDGFSTKIKKNKIKKSNVYIELDKELL